MILELVRILDTSLKGKLLKNNEVTLQLMFFDGEEAFKDWTATDSLYGSRHLAAKLETQSLLRSSHQNCQTVPRQTRLIQNELDRIEVLILLDLIGEVSPQFCSHFTETKDLFAKLVKAEKKLNQLKLLESKRRSGTKYFVQNCMFTGGVEDDHIPFVRAGVPPLHLIATPFPTQWHQPGDNGQNLHHPTINNLMKVFRLFLVEYLGLQ